MSRTGRAVYNAMHEPDNLRPAERAFAEPKSATRIEQELFYARRRLMSGIDDSRPTECPPDAPTEREWREHLEAVTSESKPVSRNDLYDTIAEMIF